MTLFTYVAEQNILQPIQLKIGLDKIIYKADGKEVRYLTVKIDKANVTQMVAEVVNLKVSKARDTYGSLIIHGSGMDVGKFIQESVFRAACQAGYPGMFDQNKYKYMGKRIPGSPYIYFKDLTKKEEFPLGQIRKEKEHD